MQTFLQQVISGATDGVLYSAMALALVLIYKGTHVLNAAQGEMALFSAYVAWSLIAAGVPMYLTFGIVIVGAFAAGVGLRYLLVPIERSQAGPLGVLSVTLGLFLSLNSLDSLIWGDSPHAFPSPFPDGQLSFGGIVLPEHQLGTAIVLAVVFALVSLFFNRTRFGLYMRAAADEPESARQAGVPVGRMLAVAWGLASAIGALAGMLIAHAAFLTPPIMFGVLVYGITAAILGGFDSPGGAIIGGLAVGIAANLSENYVGFIGSDLKIVAAMALIVVLLLVRPQGLFG